VIQKHIGESGNAYESELQQLRELQQEHVKLFERHGDVLEALEEMVNQVNYVGGVHMIPNTDGTITPAPAVHLGWYGLGRAYLKACTVLNKNPVIQTTVQTPDEDYEEEDHGRARQRKKPWRLRWPDDVRDEVLARLLVIVFVELSDQFLKDSSHGMIVDASRRKVDFGIKELVNQRADRVRFGKCGQLIAELEVVDDVLDIGREAVQVVLEIGEELLLAAARLEVAQRET